MDAAVQQIRSAVRARRVALASIFQRRVGRTILARAPTAAPARLHSTRRCRAHQRRTVSAFLARSPMEQQLDLGQELRSLALQVLRTAGGAPNRATR